MMNDEQIDRVVLDLDRIGGEISNLARVVENLCSCFSGIQYSIEQQTQAVRNQTDAIQVCASALIQPMQQMQVDIAEIRAGVDEMR